MSPVVDLNDAVEPQDMEGAVVYIPETALSSSPPS